MNSELASEIHFFVSVFTFIYFSVGGGQSAGTADSECPSLLITSNEVSSV